jgi:nitroreductase
MDVFEALYTTRAMRRVTQDPIPLDVQAKIVDAAIRAPSGGNTQNWRFLLVDDPGVKAAVGPIYRECLGGLWTTYYKPRVDAAAADPEAPESKAFVAMRASAQHLADHF